MPQATFKTPVNARIETIWELLKDKAEHPEKYGQQKVEHSRVTRDDAARSITYTLENHPVYDGTIVNRVEPGNDNDDTCGLPVMTFKIDLKAKSSDLEKSKDAKSLQDAAQPDAIKVAAMRVKQVIEEDEAVRLAKGNKNFETIRRMFLGGESMNVRNFSKWYNEGAHYQFSNFPVAYGPEGIVSSSDGFLANCRNCYHHLKNMWEVDKDTVVVEMDVSYVHHNGKKVKLPVADTVKLKNGKVQELRIYMDVNPLFGLAGK
jgi:hypothetical protein